MSLFSPCSLILVGPPRLARLPKESRAHRLLVFGIRLAVLLLGFGIAANLFGYIKLAQFLGCRVPVQHLHRHQHGGRGARVHPLLLEGVDARARSSWRWFALLSRWHGPLDAASVLLGAES